MSVKKFALVLASTLAFGAASASHALTAQAAPASYNGLALTPPMGWNDWSYYQCNIDEDLILGQARALVSTGLATKGYDTVTTDDCWIAPSRDSSGNLAADPAKFPDGMAYVGAQLHAMGLKFGIYEDAGTTTCGGYPGSWGHFSQDANAFAQWGVDYLKLDGCNVPSVSGQTTEQTYQQAYQQMSQALVATGRPIVFSASAPAYFQYGPNWQSVIGWTSTLSNLWREGADTALGQQSAAQKWSAIAYNYSYNVGLGRYAGPGHWNDPDFLLTGDSGLSADEMQSQMSLWAEMAAPLISSTDLTRLTPAALSILGNQAIIGVDQDALGVQGSIVQSGSNYDVLAKPLSDGDVSVVLFNKGASAQTIATTAALAGLPTGGPYQLTDLASGQRTVTTGTIAANVRPHATVMFRVHPHAPKGLAPASVLYLSAGTFVAGQPTAVKVAVGNYGTADITSAHVALTVPSGWTVTPIAQPIARIRPGGSAAVTFQVTSTAPPPGNHADPVDAALSYVYHGASVTTTGELTFITTAPFENLAAAFNNIAITANSNPGPGNFDGGGNSYSADALASQANVHPGDSISAGGATFTWPDVPAGVPDNVQGGGAVIKLSGSGSKLAFLGSEAGDVLGAVKVTYTDGTSTTESVGFPNWSFSSATEFGSVLAISVQGRNTQGGFTDTAYAYRVFYNSIPIDAAKTVATVTLPSSGSIHIFALTVQGS